MDALAFELNYINDKFKLSYLQPVPNLKINKHNKKMKFIDLVTNETMSIDKYCKNPYVYNETNPIKKLHFNEYDKHCSNDKV